MDTIWYGIKVAPKCTIAQIAIHSYFQPPVGVPCWRGRLQTTLPVVLNAELHNSEYQLQLHSKVDSEHVSTASIKRNGMEPIDKENCRFGTSKTDLTVVHTLVLGNSL